MIRMLLIPFFVLLCLSVTSTGLGAQCTDSLVVTPRPDGTLYLTWKLGSQTDMQTLTGVSGATHEEITRLNPVVLFRDLESCDWVLMPFDRNRLVTSLWEKPFLAQRDMYPVVYNVRPKETAFFLTKRLFDIPMEDFLRNNDLESHDLKEGQIVVLGYFPKAAAKEGEQMPGSVYEEATTSLAGGWYYSDHETLDSLQVAYETQKGVALWNKAKPDPNLFALHRNAPINSFIEITNPMFGRSVRAKVIGTIPPTYPDDICIIVSEGVARQLGAIDSRFYAEMSYAVR